MKPYSIVYKDALPHGIILGISLPDSPEPVSREILDQLHPEEQVFAQTLKGYRQVHWVGGRLAAQAAMQALGQGGPPVLTGAFGAPVVRHALTLSISHKRHLAVALLARKEHGSIGVDLEDLHPAREGIAERVLRPAELESIEALSGDRRWIATLLRFSIKEAIYKALAPQLKRYIAFSEAEVMLDLDGTASVTLHLTEGPSPEHIEARYTWLGRSVLCTVRAQWPAPMPIPPDAPVE